MDEQTLIHPPKDQLLTQHIGNVAKGDPSIFPTEGLGTRPVGTDTTSDVALNDIHCYDSGSTPHKFQLL